MEKPFMQDILVFTLSVFIQKFHIKFRDLLYPEIKEQKDTIDDL